jgi:hypothetical protein
MIVLFSSMPFYMCYYILEHASHHHYDITILEEQNT